MMNRYLDKLSRYLLIVVLLLLLILISLQIGIWKGRKLATEAVKQEMLTSVTEDWVRKQL